MSKIDPMVYQPFGAGPRNCIGMRFAVLEVKMAICKILDNFNLEMCEHTPVNQTLTDLCSYKFECNFSSTNRFRDFLINRFGSDSFVGLFLQSTVWYVAI